MDHLNGLCLTCKYNSSCMYIKNGNLPAQWCEEFEVYSYLPGIQNALKFKRKVKEDKPSFHGICKNCDNHKTLYECKTRKDHLALRGICIIT